MGDIATTDSPGQQQLEDLVQMALAEARKATAQRRNATTLDTLAAALAETGDFEQAVATQREAIAALEADQAELTDPFQARLNGYQKDVAWRE